MTAIRALSWVFFGCFLDPVLARKVLD